MARGVSYNMTITETEIRLNKLTTLDLREVGLSQRLMVWGILAWPLGFFPPAMLITIPFQLYCVYKLARALQLNAPIIAVSLLLTLAPLICLLVFLALNQKALKTLRSGGIRVGLMGANREDLPPADYTLI